MKAILVCLFVFWVVHYAWGDLIVPGKLEDLVASADHIVVGTVVKVDMVNQSGQQITDPNARTGEGSEYVIRLHVSLDKDATLKTNSSEVPAEIVVPLWKEFITSLDFRKRYYENKAFIFLLQGADFHPADPAQFIKKPSERAEIVALLNPGVPRNSILKPVFNRMAEPKTPLVLETALRELEKWLPPDVKNNLRLKQLTVDQKKFWIRQTSGKFKLGSENDITSYFREKEITSGLLMASLLLQGFSSYSREDGLVGWDLKLKMGRETQKDINEDEEKLDKIYRMLEELEKKTNPKKLEDRDRLIEGIYDRPRIG